MSKKSQKLELTWIGKGDEPKLEPRILIENPQYSYGDPNTGNMLIHGDNLLALKALEQDYAGKIKCIYIDPPYNTGNAFEHYDDNLEHSLWLSLMKPRLEILKILLKPTGVIAISINYNELAYLMVLLDEIFGRKNFIELVTLQVATTASFRSINVCPVNVAEHLVLYAKDSSIFQTNKVYVESTYSEDYSHFIENIHENSEKWNLISLDEMVHHKLGLSDWREMKSKFGSTWREIRFKEKEKIATTFPHCVVSLNTLQKPSAYITEVIENSKKQKGIVFEISREKYNPIFVYNGRTLAFFSKKIKNIDGKMVPSEILNNMWKDISFLSLGNEGGVDFPNGKKPEKLIERVLNLCTDNGDIVLDSFLGSGTTAAVAHKMGRRWIGVELGEHAKTHCYPRLKAVVDGEQGGISKSVNWQGGGGFKFYTLAPSLLNTDKYGNWVISKEYNANMLAAAMAKQEAFRYEPHESVFWKQGKSSEKDYIFTTTSFITVEMLDSINDEMQEDESLLICCKSYQSECEHRHSNITIKKIPHMLLGKCEFGKDDYSFNIVNMPADENQHDETEHDDIDAEDFVSTVAEPKKKKNKPSDEQPTLF